MVGSLRIPLVVCDRGPEQSEPTSKAGPVRLSSFPVATFISCEENDCARPICSSKLLLSHGQPPFSCSSRLRSGVDGRYQSICLGSQEGERRTISGWMQMRAKLAISWLVMSNQLRRNLQTAPQVGSFSPNAVNVACNEVGS